jgi:Copper transport outer membrane protein, MctB
VISWRYHVVSLVAVVLAFGLGVLAGTLVVGDDLVNQLRRNTEEAQRDRDVAEELAERYVAFAQGLRPTLLDDTLLGEEAVVVAMDGVSGLAQRTVQELGDAGVEVLATLELTRALAEPEVEENATVLETILDLPGGDAEDLRRGIAGALAIRLAAGVLLEEEDVLGQLLEEGFVTADRDLEPGALLGIGGPGQLVVVVAGGTAPAGFPAPEALLVPFAERLEGLDVPTTAVGPIEDPYGFVASIREAPDIPDCAMVTVDDLDLEGIGGITMVLGIDRLLADDDPVFRPGGDYGFGGDAMMVVPGADEPPQSCRA